MINIGQRDMKCVWSCNYCSSVANDLHTLKTLLPSTEFIFREKMFRTHFSFFKDQESGLFSFQLLAQTYLLSVLLG